MLACLIFLEGYPSLTVLLEVLLAGGDELDGDELEAALLEAGDDGTNEATLRVVSEPHTQHWPLRFMLGIPGHRRA